MKMRFAFAHVKCNFDDGIESLYILREVIPGRIKSQAVIAFTKRFVFGK